MLEKIELERYQRRLQELEERYKAFREHLDAVSLANAEHLRRQMELCRDKPRDSKPAEKKPKRKK